MFTQPTFTFSLRISKKPYTKFFFQEEFLGKFLRKSDLTEKSTNLSMVQTHNCFLGILITKLEMPKFCNFRSSSQTNMHNFYF